MQVKNNILDDPEIDCSLPSLEIQQLMIGMQVHKAAKDFRNVLQKYSIVPGSSHCTWISCNFEGSEKQKIIGAVAPSCSSI